jgi:hypothetical protein
MLEEIFKPVNELPCDDCNFKTNPSNCWYFGTMSFNAIQNKEICGCEKYRPWWSTTFKK